MTWLLLVVLMALSDDDVTSVFDYLGRAQPLAQPKLALTAGGTGGGAVAAPISGAAPGQTVQQGGTLSGGGANPRPGPFNVTGAVDLARNLLTQFGPAPDVTRGETGGVSLSDQVRSGSGAGVEAGAGVGAGALSAPAAAAVEAATAANAASPAGYLGPSLSSGVGGLTSGASAGGNLALDAGTSAATSAATEAAVTAAEVTLPSLADALTGVLTAGLIPIVESFFGVGPTMSGGGNQSPAQVRETQGIRKDFSTAIDPFLGGSATYGKIAQVDALPKEQQAAALQQILQESNYELAQGPAISQFISTQGGRQTKNPALNIKPVDTSALEKVSGTQSADAVLAQTAALDKLAGLGVTPDFGPSGLNISDVWANPNGILGILFAQGGVDTHGGPRDLDPVTGASGFSGDYTAMLTPQELSALAQPGNRMQTIRSILTRLNPDFANSPLGQSMGVSPGSATQPAEQPGSSLSPSSVPSFSASGPAGALGFADQLLQTQ